MYINLKAIKFKDKLRRDFCTHPFTQSGLEVVKDEVRVLFWHVANVWDVVPHHQVADGEVGGWSERLGMSQQRLFTACKV